MNSCPHKPNPRTPPSENFSPSYQNFPPLVSKSVSFLLQFALRDLNTEISSWEGKHEDESKSTARWKISRVQLKYHSINFYLSLVTYFAGKVFHRISFKFYCFSLVLRGRGESWINSVETSFNLQDRQGKRNIRGVRGLKMRLNLWKLFISRDENKFHFTARSIWIFHHRWCFYLVVSEEQFPSVFSLQWAPAMFFFFSNFHLEVFSCWWENREMARMKLIRKSSEMNPLAAIFAVLSLLIEEIFRDFLEHEKMRLISLKKAFLITDFRALILFRASDLRNKLSKQFPRKISRVLFP